MASATSDDGLGQKLIPFASDVRVVSSIERRGSSSDESDKRENRVTRRSGARRDRERTPLIRPRNSDDEASSICSSDYLPRRYGAVLTGRNTERAPDSSAGLFSYTCIKTLLCWRSVSVMSFLLLLVTGLVLVAASHLNTDNTGLKVKPHHVLVYVMLLMTVFILWATVAIFPQKIQYSSQHDGSLIPSHLLTGIGIFGTAAAIFQMVLFVDFVKCSRHVKNLNVIYGIYPFYTSIFVYFQIYFFYKLSRDGIRDRKVPGGNFFVMLTLATNLCIWGLVFLTDASNDQKLEDVSWLTHYHYGVSGHDPCANASIASSESWHLHDIVSYMKRYMAAFAMEYALLASGLLLHIWRSMDAPQASRLRRFERQDWTLWRLGFILGLLCLPFIFAAYIAEVARERVSTAKAVLYFIEFALYLILIVFSRYCTVLLNNASGFVKHSQPVRLEVYLLGISIIGFPILDLLCGFASICELGNLPTLEVVWYGVSSLLEVIAVGLQFLLVKKAYELRLPEVADRNVVKVAGYVRQFASFAVVVNIGYWAAKTYELRRPSNPSIAEIFFGSYAWFALAHLAYPFCIFFHFHLAICYADVVFFFSQFGPLFNGG